MAPPGPCISKWLLSQFQKPAGLLSSPEKKKKKACLGFDLEQPFDEQQ